jgi:hypothetical protein
MRNSRNPGVIGGILIALVVIIYLLLSPVRTEQAPPVARAPQSASSTAAATPSAAPSAPAQSPTPSPVPTSVYVNPTYKFSVTLPAPYRRSARLSIENSGGSAPAAADAFTARSLEDEAALASQRCETACVIWNYAADIGVFTGTGTQTPRDFYNAFQFSRDQQLEDLMIDGHQALKVTNSPSYPVEYLVKDGDRMFMLGYNIYQGFEVPAGASKEKLDAILMSFRFVP